MTKEFKMIAVVGVVILIALIVFKKRSSYTPSLTAPKATKDIVKPKAFEIVESKKTTPLPPSSISYQVIVKRDKMEKTVGLKRMALPMEGEEAVLSVTLSIKPVCHPGDADAILKDLKAEPSHKLLATLEDLSGQGKSFSWDIQQSIFKDGKAEKVFKIPVKADSSQYGFFVCTANSSDNTCSDKNIKDVNQIFTEHLTKQPNAGKEVRNIFFQYFLIDERGISTFNRIPRGDGNPAFDNLKKHIIETNALGKPNHAEVDFVKKALKTNDSLPAVFSNGNLILELPKFKERACF